MLNKFSCMSLLEKMKFNKYKLIISKYIWKVTKHYPHLISFSSLCIICIKRFFKLDWNCSYLELGEEVYEEFLSQNGQCGISDMSTVHSAAHASLVAGVYGEDVLDCKGNDSFVSGRVDYFSVTVQI